MKSPKRLSDPDETRRLAKEQDEAKRPSRSKWMSRIGRSPPKIASPAERKYR